MWGLVGGRAALAPQLQPLAGCAFEAALPAVFFECNKGRPINQWFLSVTNAPSGENEEKSFMEEGMVYFDLEQFGRDQPSSTAPISVSPPISRGLPF
jgi:hypothetical protein